MPTLILVAGAVHTVPSRVYSSAPEFRLGDPVPILFRPDAPESARIDSYWHVWGLASALGIISAIALPAGFVFVFFPRILSRQ